MLIIDLNYCHNILIINLTGSLNRNTSYKINNYLIPAILKHNIKYGILNLNKLNELDDDGIDSLLNVKSAFQNNKGLVYLEKYNNVLLKKIHKLHLKKINSDIELFNIMGV